MKVILIASYIILLFLHAFDMYSTHTILMMGGEEANPIMHLAMIAVGVLPAMFILKGIFFVLLAVAYIKAVKMKKLKMKEYVALYGATFVLIVYYIYFMYTRNLQYLLSIT